MKDIEENITSRQLTWTPKKDNIPAITKQMEIKTEKRLKEIIVILLWIKYITTKITMFRVTTPIKKIIFGSGSFPK